ncbi:MAG: hypothetical protein IPK19_26200 [Chloroflexi bacterium]|nr:hypothetical protein [Chloroflexota bacterium]
MVGAIWTHSDLTSVQRLMATAHLAQYLVHVLIILPDHPDSLLIVFKALPSFSFGPLGLVSLFPGC